MINQPGIEWHEDENDPDIKWANIPGAVPVIVSAEGDLVVGEPGTAKMYWKKSALSTVLDMRSVVKDETDSPEVERERHEDEAREVFNSEMLARGNEKGKLWVVTVTYDPQWDDMPEADITSVIGVADCRNTARELAQSVIEGEIQWCWIWRKDPYYDESNMDGLLFGGSPVLSVEIDGCDLNQIHNRYA